MFDALKNIDWNKYRYGRHPKDLQQLLIGLMSADRPIRLHANSELYEEIESAFRRESDLPLVLAPLLCEMLNHAPEPYLVTDLLLLLTSYTHNDLPEPLRTLGIAVKTEICTRLPALDGLLAHSDAIEDMLLLRAECLEDQQA